MGRSAICMRTYYSHYLYRESFQVLVGQDNGEPQGAYFIKPAPNRF